MSDLLSSTFTVGADKYTIDRYATRTGPSKWPAIVVNEGDICKEHPYPGAPQRDFLRSTGF
jgi:hypothetical protein